MQESSNLTTSLRILLTLARNLIDICEDSESEKDLDQITEHLIELRNTLEKLVKVAKRLKASDPSGSSQSSPSEQLNIPDGLLLDCMSELRGIESYIKGAGGSRMTIIETSTPPSDAIDTMDEVLKDLERTTIALKGVLVVPTKSIPQTDPEPSRIHTTSLVDSRFNTINYVYGDQINHTFVHEDKGKIIGEVLDWLAAPDPSSNQRNIDKKREPDTGLWFVNGAQFNKWKAAAGSFLWLHGIPGCGKSVLCSAIVKNVVQHCEAGSSLAIAYFYFDFNDPRKQTSSHLVRSLLTQFSRSNSLQSLPEALVDLHTRRCRSLGGEDQPVDEDLLDVLKQVIESFQDAYIIIDALDECKDQHDLLTVLEKIAGWELDNLHIIATSRRERYIEDRLLRITSAPIHLGSELVDGDIKVYLNSRLRDDIRFRKWTSEEQEEIDAALMRGAQGMFRWVACQLDALSKCSSLKMLREALRHLPRTLDETYDRILLNIPEEHRGDAMTILQWLAFSVRPLNLNEIAEVLAIDCDDQDPCFDPDQRLREPRDILDICSSLVALSDGKTGSLSLAHLSVRDYLLSERITNGPACQYHLNPVDGEARISRACLIYLLHFDSPNSLQNRTPETLSLGRYAALFWIVHWKAGINSDIAQSLSLLSLINELFQPQSAQFENWVRLDSHHDLISPIAVPSPLYRASLLGLTLTVQHLLSTYGTDDLDSLTGGATPLVAALIQGHKGIVKILLDHGPDVNLVQSEVGNYGSALITASKRGYEDIVRILLDCGADVNWVGGPFGSALMVASGEGRQDIVEMLLESGASLNSRAKDADNASFISSRRVCFDEVVEILE